MAWAFAAAVFSLVLLWAGLELALVVRRHWPTILAALRGDLEPPTP